jgi:ribonuclease HII
MWKGDQVAACVAAASIIAKVTRDAIMCGLDHDYPEYGFARHKGYSTRSHMNALTQHGPCPEHRRSFVNVRGRAVPAADLEPGNSGPANSCYEPGSGQNGPIVEAIEEYGWPTADFAAMARGA